MQVTFFRHALFVLETFGVLGIVTHVLNFWRVQADAFFLAAEGFELSDSRVSIRIVNFHFLVSFLQKNTHSACYVVFGVFAAPDFVLLARGSDFVFLAAVFTLVTGCVGDGFHAYLVVR